MRPTNWIGPIVIAVVMGGVAYSVSDHAARSTQLASSETPRGASGEERVEPVATTSVRFEVGIRSPDKDHDRRFVIDTATKSVTELETPKGWRVEELNETTASLRLASSDDRGFRITDGADWNVPLRTTSGEAYMEPHLLGLFDERHAAVVARTDRRRILNVSRVGQTTPIADVPEYANVLGLRDGFVWMSTFVPGQGIESDPLGPSDLLAVHPDGTVLKKGTLPSLITMVVAEGNAYAIGDDGGRYQATFPSGTFVEGIGVPLAWNGDRLLMSAGSKLLFVDSSNVPEDLGVSLDAAPAVARFVE